MGIDAPRPTPAEVYERAFVPGMFLPLTREVVARARPARGERVLDLACGTGVVARHVAPIVGTSGAVLGLDLRPGMIAVARDAPRPDGVVIDWLVGDATALDLPDAAFDLVICQQGLQFFDDRPAALREIRRVLRPGGRFVAAVWHGIERQPLLHGLVEIEVRHLGPLGLTWEDAAASFLLGDGDELERLVAGAGFRDVGVEAVTIETDFAADTFVPDVEFAYGAVFPAFLEVPAAHAGFVAAVERDAAGLVERYREGDRLRSPMSTNVVTARTPDG